MDREDPIFDPLYPWTAVGVPTPGAQSRSEGGGRSSLGGRGRPVAADGCGMFFEGQRSWGSASKILVKYNEASETAARVA